MTISFNGDHFNRSGIIREKNAMQRVLSRQSLKILLFYLMLHSESWFAQQIYWIILLPFVSSTSLKLSSLSFFPPLSQFCFFLGSISTSIVVNHVTDYAVRCRIPTRSTSTSTSTLLRPLPTIVVIANNLMHSHCTNISSDVLPISNVTNNTFIPIHAPRDHSNIHQVPTTL